MPFILPPSNESERCSDNGPYLDPTTCEELKFNWAIVCGLYNADIASSQVFDSEAEARIALPIGSVFRYSEANIDGVPSPNNSTLGLIA